MGRPRMAWQRALNPNRALSRLIYSRFATPPVPPAPGVPWGLPWSAVGPQRSRVERKQRVSRISQG
jgi:hypothetical protein